MLNHNPSDMSVVYGLENKAIKLFWHSISHNERKSEERELQKCVLHWRPIRALLVGETALQPPPALLCVRDLFYALFITTNRPPE